MFFGQILHDDPGCGSNVVADRRDGRHAYYRLHDDHAAELLAAIRHHEHVHTPELVFVPEPSRELSTA